MKKVISYASNRNFLAIIALLMFSQIKAQKIEKFYDYKWEKCKPNAARFYSLITKSDSGYFRKNYYIKERTLQMEGNYEDSLCKIENGRFILLHPNGSLKEIGKYKHGKKEGIWLSYHNNGIISDSAVFIQNKKIGKSLSWYPNGAQRDSVYLNEDGSGIEVTWFDNCFPSSAGRYSAGKKQTGRWMYYHLNGKISSIETYYESKLIDKKHYDENGIIMKDSTNNDRPALFPGGVDAWKKYMFDNIYFPEGYRIVNADKAIVIVTFTINENGQIENVFTSTSFDKTFDEIAEKAIKKSPRWLPAIEHNRRVKSIFHQPMSFKNSNEF